MINILQQFYKALAATMTACRHKADVQEEAVASLTEQLRVMTAERDLFIAEQEEAISGQMEYYGYYKLPEASSYSTGFFTGAGYGSNPKFNNFIPVSHTYGYDFLQKLIKM